jgi:hypothetical protein
MLINKFQRRQEKAKGREEWARRNEFVGRMESNYQWWKIIQNATEPTTMVANPRGFASQFINS